MVSLGFYFIIRLLYLLEPFFSKRFKFSSQIFDLVGMILAGKSPIGLFNRFLRGASFNFKYLVWIPPAGSIPNT